MSTSGLKYYLAACVLLLACSSERNQATHLAFYHWQSRLDVSKQEEAYLEALAVKKIYVRFFDVDWDEERRDVVPLAELELGRLPDDTLHIVAVIFITNRTLLKIAGEELPRLSARIRKKIRQHWRRLPKSYSLKQIQLDCDWSGQSQQAFFKLIELLKKDFSRDSLQISATIRLHQLKYPKRTGVPPADRGMLMYYNMGELERPDERNSILDNKVGKSYLQNTASYPLPLDLALPLFRWGVVFRDGRMIRLIHELGPEMLADSSRFLKTSSQRYELVKSTYLQGHYLYEGDFIRLESVSYADLEEAARLIGPQMPPLAYDLTFYHLDSAIINRYSHESLLQIKAVLDRTAY